MVAKQRSFIDDIPLETRDGRIPLEMRVRPFEPPKFSTLEAWYQNFQEAMVGANKAWRRFDIAVAKLKERARINNWPEAVYRDQFKEDWEIQDALDDWRMYKDEVARFKNALDIVAQMIKLEEVYAGAGRYDLQQPA